MVLIKVIRESLNGMNMKMKMKLLNKNTSRMRFINNCTSRVRFIDNCTSRERYIESCRFINKVTSSEDIKFGSCKF